MSRPLLVKRSTETVLHEKSCRGKPHATVFSPRHTFMKMLEVSTKLMNIVLWILQIGVAAIMLSAGYSKLTGSPQMVEVFDQIGIGQWFRYVTGILEAVGGLAMLIPTYAGVGAILVAGVMLGGVITHLFVIGGNPLMAALLLLASLVVAWGRRDRAARLFD